MSDEPTPEPPAEAPASVAPSSDATTIASLEAAASASASELTALRAQIDGEARRVQEEQGKFEALYQSGQAEIADIRAQNTELAKARDSLDALKKNTLSRIDERAKTVTESQRDILGMIDDPFSRETALQKMIDAQAEPGPPRPPRSGGPAPRGGSDGEVTDDEIPGLAQRDPARWSAYKAQLGLNNGARGLSAIPVSNGKG